MVRSSWRPKARTKVWRTCKVGVGRVHSLLERGNRETPETKTSRRCFGFSERRGGQYILAAMCDLRSDHEYLNLQPSWRNMDKNRSRGRTTHVTAPAAEEIITIATHESFLAFRLDLLCISTLSRNRSRSLLNPCAECV